MVNPSKKDYEKMVKATQTIFAVIVLVGLFTGSVVADTLTFTNSILGASLQGQDGWNFYDLATIGNDAATHIMVCNSAENSVARCTTFSATEMWRAVTPHNTLAELRWQWRANDSAARMLFGPCTTLTSTSDNSVNYRMQAGFNGAGKWFVKGAAVVIDTIGWPTYQANRWYYFRAQLNAGTNRYRLWMDTLANRTTEYLLVNDSLMAHGGPFDKILLKSNYGVGSVDIDSIYWNEIAPAPRNWIGGGGNSLWSNPQNWSGMIVPSASDSVVFASSAYACSLDVAITVRSLSFTSGQLAAIYPNGKKISVLTHLAMPMPGAFVSSALDTISFAGSGPMTFIPKSGTTLPALIQAGSGTTTVLGEGFKTDALIVQNGTFDLGSSGADTVNAQLVVKNGTLNLGISTLRAGGSVDFRSANAIQSGGGGIEFTGVAMQHFYPAAGILHPALKHRGTGVLTVSANRLRTQRFDVLSGQVTMDTALFIDTVNLSAGTLLNLDTAAGNVDTIKRFEGYGSLNFGGTELFTASNISLSMLAVVSGAGKLAFFGTEAITFKPKNGFLHQKIEKWGTGTLQVEMYGMSALQLSLHEGTWNWYTSGNDTIYDTLWMDGGTMQLSSASLHVGSIFDNSGALHFNRGRLITLGSSGTIELNSLSTLTPDSGTIEFSGSGSSAYTFYPGNRVFPPILVNGGTSDTVRFAGNLTAQSVRQSNGVIDWGAGYVHVLDTLMAQSGAMIFGSSTVEVAVADANLMGLSGLTPGTGILKFTSSSGTQQLVLPSVSQIPAVVKTNGGTLKFTSNKLTCRGISIEGGTVDFSGLHATVQGNFTVTNKVATAFTGIGGIVITVNGNTTFSGQSGNLLTINPGTVWGLAVTGALAASYTSLAYCNASGGSPGTATGSCTDAGNNSNWTFLAADNFPPDNDMVLQTDAAGLDALTVTWTPATIDSTDRDSVGLWYRTDGFPKSASDGAATLLGVFPVLDSVQTIRGLNAHTEYYVAAAVRDTAGNWSAITTAARDSAITFTEPPIIGKPLGTVHYKKVNLSWSNPAGLSGTDFIFIHLDTLSGSGWVLDTVLQGFATSVSVAFPLVQEGIYRYMISTSRDSAGVNHREDALIDTFTYAVDPPVIATGLDTIHRKKTPITWTNPSGLSFQDSIYIEYASLAGSAWNMVAVVPYNETTCTLSFSTEGSYAYRISTSQDSAGNMNVANACYDTVVFAIDPPTITTPFTLTEDLNPVVTWTAPAGLLATDSIFIFTDTVTGVASWKRFGAYSYLRTSAQLSFLGIGTYMYRITTSLDSMARLDSENAAEATIVIADTTGPRGTVVVQDAGGFTIDPDPLLTINATGADSMRIALAADTAKTVWTVYAPIDSINIAAGGSGVRIVGVQWKDRAGNRSAWSYDSTLYDGEVPRTKIATRGNFTYESWQGMVSGTVIDSFSGADTVWVTIRQGAENRFWNGTSWQSLAVTIVQHTTGMWHLAVPFDSLVGRICTVTARAQDRAGNKERVGDSAEINCTLRPKALFSAAPVLGTIPCTVVFLDSSTGTVTGRRWNFGDGKSDTARQLSHSYLHAGSFTVALTVFGPGGTDSIVKVNCIVVLPPPVPPPVLPPVSCRATAINCSTVVVSWVPDTGAAADTIRIAADRNGWPGGPKQGEFLRVVPGTARTDTLRGLPIEGYQLFIRLFTGNSMGIWSDTASAASAVVAVPGGFAPYNPVVVSAKLVGDSAVNLTISTQAPVDSLTRLIVGYGYSPQEAVGSAIRRDFIDTTMVITGLFKAGWWYMATAVEDQAGNRSLYYLDSMKILNSAPTVRIKADTLVSEDSLWVAELVTTDRNGDSVSCTLLSGPAGAVLRQGELSWTANDQDIGRHTIIVGAYDGQGGTATDTIEVTVVNREERPKITWMGLTRIPEDLTYSTVLQVLDPDPNEWHTTVVLKKPLWLTLTDDTLRGTPLDRDVGSDSVVVMTTDKSGLTDTVRVQITVVNVNDTPVLVSCSIPDTLYEKTMYTAKVVIADPDPADTLQVNWSSALPWITVKQLQRDTLQGIWNVTLQLAPQQPDTGLIPLVLTFTDRAGSLENYHDTILVRDINDPPKPPNVTRRASGGAVEYTVVSEDDYDSVLLYTARLQSLHDSTLLWVNRSNKGLFSFYPLPDGWYRFSATAIDKAGLETPAVFDTLVITGSSQRIFTDTLWSMVSVPAAFSVKLLNHTRYLLHWDESVEERQIYHFYRQTDQITMLEPGMGYWRQGSGSDTINLTYADLLKKTVKIPISRNVTGWNQIASPYPYPVAWRGKTSTLWRWNSATSDYEEGDSILLPWSGYWVQSDNSDSVVIDSKPVFGSSALAKRSKIQFHGVKKWVAQLTLTTPNGRDNENTFGFLPDAQDGYDKLDRVEPPRMGGTPYLFFPHSNWKRGLVEYAADIRKTWQPVNVFEFAIAPASQHGEASLVFEGVTPNGPLYFFMRDHDTIIPVDPSKALSVRVTEKVQYKTLFVTDNPQGMQNLPLRFKVGNPYPNPFRPTTRMQYALPYRWGSDGKMVTSTYVVSVDIFDLMGRKVRNLVYRRMEPGSYELFWDGKSSSGRMVSCGHYLCRFRADKFTDVKNLLVVH